MDEMATLIVTAALCVLFASYIYAVATIDKTLEVSRKILSEIEELKGKLFVAKDDK